MNRNALQKWLGLLLLVGLLAACLRKPPPELGAVGAFSVVDQDNQPVTQASLLGKPWIAAFMFTRCPTVCPRITARMRDLQQQAASDGVDVRFVSFTVDPDHDTPAILKRYARDQHVNEANWRLLTGDFEAIKKTSVESFKLALEGKPQEGADHLGVLHGSHLVLVDERGKIRGYYATKDDEAMKQLLVDAKSLR